jgi:hypothetical protein
LSQPSPKCDAITLAKDKGGKNRDGNRTTTETRTLATSKTATQTARSSKELWTQDDRFKRGFYS